MMNIANSAYAAVCAALIAGFGLVGRALLNNRQPRGLRRRRPLQHNRAQPWDQK